MNRPVTIFITAVDTVASVLVWGFILACVLYLVAILAVVAVVDRRVLPTIEQLAPVDPDALADVYADAAEIVRP